MIDWVDATKTLPPNERIWNEYLVSVFDNGSNDLFGGSSEREYSTSAQYDSTQKIWHLNGSEIDALIHPEHHTGGLCITHWAELPKPAGLL